MTDRLVQGAPPRSDADRSLRVSDVSVSYLRGERALDGVSVEFAAGEVHALLGSNGSGKSSLIKTLSGVVAPLQTARISVNGRPAVSVLTPQKARDFGLRFVHQNLALLPELSILENFFLTNDYPRRAGAIDRRSARAIVTRALGVVGLVASANRRVDQLRPSDRVLTATARALVGLPAGGGYLFMDEPTAVLDYDESARLLSHLRNLAKNEGVGIILVTHRLHEVAEYADRVTILRDGKVARSAPVADLNEAAIIAELAPVGDSKKPPASAGAPAAGGGKVFIVEGLTGSKLSDATFSVGEGEILGVTGLEGSGAHEVVEIACGMRPPERGEMTLLGHPFAPRQPRDAVRRGVGVVPVDRLELGGVAELTVGTNLQLARFADFVRWGWFRTGRAARESREGLANAAVTPPDPNRLFSTLSGGNQQKVIVGRWLEARCVLLVLHEPTAGVDVAARKAIYARLRQAAASGLAILVVSSDLMEIAELCNRALVLVDGSIAAVVPESQLNVSTLTKYSYSTSNQEAS